MQTKESKRNMKGKEMSGNERTFGTRGWEHESKREGK
jgi:hypothetical protein